MTDLRQRMLAIVNKWPHTPAGAIADAAIDLVLEEAAKVAEMLSGKVRPGNIAEALYIPPTAKDAAAAIRALKDKP